MDHDLDTQNFEQFDEDAASVTAAAGTSGAQAGGGGGGDAGGAGGSGRKSVAAKADPNFIGYTYKNWEAVQPEGSWGEGLVSSSIGRLKVLIISWSADLLMPCYFYVHIFM